MKNKRYKKSKNKEVQVLNVRQMNEQITSILKGIVRQSQQAAGANANLSTKRILQMRSQGLLKSSVVTSAALRPLFSVISKSVKNMDNITISNVRN